ncbi:hypothetical protein Q7F20_07620 [Curtobacterium sp. A7_M15]|uniref:hypothetical protein n=1 Tax=Curtobacterium sp. A7_M15 TaxID=3065241 RepID=UPI002737B7AE|nr:hypothetical protein [Curtobacterium sp. A7_M15]MDP4333237.1 hypothetical protein [Curtobacterium sp. A7_M15]
MIVAATAPNPAEVSNDHFGIIVGGIVAVLVALCTLGGIVLPLLIKARNDAAVARDQTANNHESNLRDDMDGKHEDQAVRIDWIVAAVTYLLDRDQTGGADARKRAELMNTRPESRHP